MVSSSEIFGSNVFDIEKMKKKLPKGTFHALENAIDEGIPLRPEDADTIAHAIMEWALSKGATHYTHWFQPMTGLTAQKHDAFFGFDSYSKPIERFSGNQLIQSEPDASSFPSGGMRSTFEARGYTAWDPSSPVFIMMNGKVPVLCIPSVFFSYTGQALDKKTPLLRSIRTLDLAASKALKLFNDNNGHVSATLGCEQEYFLVDRGYFEKRPDLLMAGRTIIGCRPAKGQQMEDHYFGSIKDRVLAFMESVEEQLYTLGVPCKTRHNEVAPHQFEMAPIFETANIAADHNQLTMEVIKKVAREHNLAALLHEKPFADVNGSGKHLNWSMQTQDETNLLEPGTEPHRNLEFLYFLVAVIKAVHKRGPVLRSAIASAGNDHRLGANEAPPAIMSVFLGSHLTQILDRIETAQDFSEATVASIDLGLAQLPDIRVDTTDRNRTSPFAFTGNKFEFRALGSNQSISLPAAFLNIAVAESLDEMNAELEKLDKIDEKSVFKLLRPFIKDTKSIRFEGNNYSEEWANDAEQRGLPNLRTTPDAIEVWNDADVRGLMKKSGLLNEQEMDARYSISMEHYAKTIGIEASLMLRLVANYVLPASIRYQTDLASSINSLRTANGQNPSAAIDMSLQNQMAFLETVSENINRLLNGRNKLEGILGELAGIEDEHEEASLCAQRVVPLMEELRTYCDDLESLIDSNLWALPSYHELLFLM